MNTASRNLPMTKGPGKFEGEPEIVRALWNMGMEGYSDEDIGSYMLFRFSPTFRDILDYTPTDDELALLTGSGGVILWESDQGFVYSTFFENTEELEAAWLNAETDDE